MAENRHACDRRNLADSSVFSSEVHGGQRVTFRGTFE